MAGGKGKGRKKVEIVKMENQNNLLVTFSKRRAGVFKKASELSTLCGVEVAVVVFSPGEKVFSFGHPSVEAVVEKFLGHDNPPPQVKESGGVVLPTEQLIEAHRDARVHELITELSLIEMEMEMEKKRGEKIDEIVKANREAQGWMRGSYDELKLEQLLALNNGMKTLMNDVYQKTYNQLMMTQGNGFPTVGSTSNSLNGDGGEALPFSGDGATTSAFPANTCMPSGFNIASTSGGAGDNSFCGGGATASGFPFSPFASGVTVFPPEGSTSSAINSGGGASGGAKASVFPVNAYMPSGFNIASTISGAGALPFNGGSVTASALPINAYMPSGFNIASTSGDAGALPFRGDGATASAFPVKAYLPSDASGGSGANLGNGPGFF